MMKLSNLNLGLAAALALGACQESSDTPDVKIIGKTRDTATEVIVTTGSKTPSEKVAEEFLMTLPDFNHGGHPAKAWGEIDCVEDADIETAGSKARGLSCDYGDGQDIFGTADVIVKEGRVTGIYDYNASPDNAWKTY